MAWAGGGDGVRQPRAELVGRACGCEPLELRLSYGGRTLRYRVQRAGFNPLGINQFTWVEEPAPLAGEFPRVLTVRPL